MKANLLIGRNNIIEGVRTYPLNKDGIIVEIESLNDIHVGYDTYVNGKVVKNKQYDIDKDNMSVIVKIDELKKKLQKTDYKCLKYVDGALSKEEYEEVKELRQSYRDEINRLEETLK